MNIFQNKVFLIVFASLLAFQISACRKETASENIASIENTNVISNVNAASNKPANVVPKNYKSDPKLQAKADSFLKSFGNMPSVPVYIKDEPIIKTGSETQRGVAYTTCENKKDPTIFFKKVFYDKANEKQLANIVKHELVHAWFCRGGEIIGHDERFRAKFKEVGGFGN